VKTTSQNRSPIVEFLGEDAGQGGPFALLGLRYEIESDTQIIRACNRRLGQIDHHRHRSTPDASEVRLAVHAATSQLLDPVLRTQLTKRWPEGVPVSVPQAWKAKPASPKLSPMYVARARALIAASGGWNANARKRLAHFARMNRVAALELIEAISPSRRSDTGGVDLVQKSIARATPKDLQLLEPPPRRSVQWLIAYALVIVMGVLVTTTIVVAPPRAGLSATDSDESDLNKADGSRSRQELQGDSEEVRLGHHRDEITHYTAIAHEIDQLVVKGEQYPDASVERFGTIYPLFVESWTSFPQPALSRAELQIGEFVYRITQEGSSIEPLLNLFACASSDLDPSALIIRVSTIDVVLSDPRLDEKTRSVFSTIRRLCSGYDPRPTQNIAESLIAVAGLVGVDSRIDDPVWWESWLNAVRSAIPDDESQRTRLVLSAMSARLHDQTLPNGQWTKSVVLLVNELSWRAGSPERYWLLSQFADETVSTPRLSALTLALATQSSAEHINTQMVLNPSSTFLQQQSLAKEYRRVWGDSSSSSSSTDAPAGGYPELVNELHIRVSITPVKMNETQVVESIIELARLNTAAWEYNRGEDSEAAETIKGVESPIGSSASLIGVNLDSNQRDTRWAEEAINAQSPSQLSALFPQLIADDGPGVNSAHALVYLATRNANSEIRSLASAQIRRFQDRPSVLMALDMAIGEKRISSRLEQLILSVLDRPLPSRSDPSWFIVAHRALIGRTAQSLGGTIESPMAALEAELGAVYRRRLDPLQQQSQQSEGSISSVAHRLTIEMFKEVRAQHFQSSMDGFDLPVIESALEVRLREASSDMHRFLAYQRSICQLHALLTINEVPGSSFRVREVLSELSTRLSQSGSVLEQIAQAERSIAQLWVIRLEGGRP
jgi:hypothetical protein